MTDKIFKVFTICDIIESIGILVYILMSNARWAYFSRHHFVTAHKSHRLHVRCMVLTFCIIVPMQIFAFDHFYNHWTVAYGSASP